MTRSSSDTLRTTLWTCLHLPLICGLVYCTDSACVVTFSRHCKVRQGTHLKWLTKETMWDCMRKQKSPCTSITALVYQNDMTWNGRYHQNSLLVSEYRHRIFGAQPQKKWKQLLQLFQNRKDRAAGQRKLGPRLYGICSYTTSALFCCCIMTPSLFLSGRFEESSLRKFWRSIGKIEANYIVVQGVPFSCEGCLLYLAKECKCVKYVWTDRSKPSTLRKVLWYFSKLCRRMQVRGGHQIAQMGHCFSGLEDSLNLVLQTKHRWP